MKLRKLTTKLTVLTLTFALIAGVGLLTLGSQHETDETKVTVTASGEGLWVYPGPRKLNPEVFGTPVKA